MQTKNKLKRKYEQLNTTLIVFIKKTAQELCTSAATAELYLDVLQSFYERTIDFQALCDWISVWNEGKDTGEFPKEDRLNIRYSDLKSNITSLYKDELALLNRHCSQLQMANGFVNKASVRQYQRNINVIENAVLPSLVHYTTARLRRYRKDRYMLEHLIAAVNDATINELQCLIACEILFEGYNRDGEILEDTAIKMGLQLESFIAFYAKDNSQQLVNKLLLEAV